MVKNFVPRLFALYCKRLCDCLIYPLETNQWQHQISKTNFEVLKKHLKVLCWWIFTCAGTISLNYEVDFLKFPCKNCFWCYCRQLFISYYFRKFKQNCNILKIILVPGFCQQKTENGQFLSDFNLSFLCHPTEQLSFSPES